MKEIKSKNSVRKPFTISNTIAWMAFSIPFGIVTAKNAGQLVNCLLCPIGIYLISLIWTYLVKKLSEIALFPWLKKKLDISGAALVWLALGIVLFCVGAIGAVCGFRMSILFMMSDSFTNTYTNIGESIIMGLAGGTVFSVIYMLKAVLFKILACWILDIPRIIIERTVWIVLLTYDYVSSRSKKK